MSVEPPILYSAYDPLQNMVLIVLLLFLLLSAGLLIFEQWNRRHQ